MYAVSNGAIFGKSAKSGASSVGGKFPMTVKGSAHDAHLRIVYCRGFLLTGFSKLHRRRSGWSRSLAEERSTGSKDLQRSNGFCALLTRWATNRVDFNY